MPSPIRALTRTEAEARAGLIRVEGYAISLDVTDPSTFLSRTTVEFRCTAPGAATFAEVKDAGLDRIVLNGRALDPATLDGNRLPLPGLLAANRLEVTFTAAYSHAGEGLHRSVDPEDGEAYLYGQAPLDEAQRIFACFDQPDLKAPITLTVTAPAQWTVRGNAPLRAGRTTGGGASSRPRRSRTYLFTVLAGPWHVRTAEHDGIPLGLLCRRSLAPQLDGDAEELFAAHGRELRPLPRALRRPLPLRQVRPGVRPRLRRRRGGEPGHGHLPRGAAVPDRRPGLRAHRRAVIIAHEMAHMWFGDLVTLRWWDDIWLNESFAEYMGYRVAAEATGRYPAPPDRLRRSRASAGAYVADQRPSTHPVAAATRRRHRRRRCSTSTASPTPRAPRRCASSRVRSATTCSSPGCGCTSSGSASATPPSPTSSPSSARCPRLDLTGWATAGCGPPGSTRCALLPGASSSTGNRWPAPVPDRGV